MLFKTALRSCLAMAGFAVLVSCGLGPSDPATEMYVQVPQASADDFTGALAEILKKQGFGASIGRTTDPSPSTNHVLEARSLYVRVWSQNAVLDPGDDKTCGYPGWSPVDRMQYLVSVQPMFSVFKNRARSTFVTLKSELMKRGYRITNQQLRCQSLNGSGAASLQSAAH